MGAAPHAVELLGGGFHKGWIIGEDAGFEVAAVAAFHSYSGSGQVGGADIGCLEIEDYDFEMDSWAEHPLQACFQYRIEVKILPEGLTRFFGMNQPDFNS